MTRLRILAAGLCVAAPGAASAQDGPVDWTVEATIGATSDYRFRGMSLSGGDPVLQGGATLTHGSGVYADIYLSGIEAYGVSDGSDGADLEVTLTGGWSGAWLGLDWDAAVSAYRYPGGDDVDYIELPVQAGRAYGPVTATVGVAYAPAQRALGDQNNRYVWTGLDYEPDTWPVSLAASVGYEEGAWAPDGKTDWRVGGFAPLGRVTVGLEWVDSDAEPGVWVASLFTGF
ncbi:MAG: hypothetical protein EON86_01120 [Brevundimonas sp.]|nr:MAG: hypothetical protein EON86_01120 [Brevundimonas sp.]